MHDPQVPETLEGWCLLHQMFRVRRTEWNAQKPQDRQTIAQDAATRLGSMDRGAEGTSVLCSLLGHKGDLMLIHLRRDFEALQRAQLAVSQMRLTDSLEAVDSFVSIVELGLYEMTAVIHARLAEQGLVQGTPDYESAFDVQMEEQRRRVAGRLFCDVPPARFVCFYPMNKRRGEQQNWYRLPVEERARLMRDHGKVGRKYSGQVTQIISGATGLDDWEWGVDLFADDPVVFKKLIYEMRFDEASALYAEFGRFYVGLRLQVADLGRWLAGECPDWHPTPPAR
jgi:peroxiredoxin